MVKLLLFTFLGLVFVTCKRESSIFITKAEHENNLKKIRLRNVQMLKQLSAYGVGATSGLSLDFYFATNDSLKAQHLADELEKSGSHSNRVHRSTKDRTLWIVTANTSRVSMDSASLNSWTTSACELGYKNDCEFEGWSPVTE
jgi:hypothetical protein